jgi:hypothetical protein
MVFKWCYNYVTMVYLLPPRRSAACVHTHTHAHTHTHTHNTYNTHTMVSQWWYLLPVKRSVACVPGVTMVLQWCCKDVTMVSP